MIRVHARGDGRDLGARLLDRRAGSESRHHLGHPVRASGHHRRAHVVLAAHHVHQGVDPSGKIRRRLQHADDRDRLAADAQDLAEHGRIAGEALQPVVVRQHHHRRRARAVVSGVERPAEHRAETHDREVVSGHQADVDTHRVVVAHQAEGHRRVLGDAAAEGLRGGTEVVDLGHRETHVVAAGAGGRLAKIHQPIAVPVRQRPQQHAAHHAEDRGVGADAEAQGEEHRERETARAGEASKGIAKIEHQHGVNSPRLAGDAICAHQSFPRSSIDLWRTDLVPAAPADRRPGD